jgi:hypothetical protein
VLVAEERRTRFTESDFVVFTPHRLRYNPGADPGDGRTRRAPLLKLEKNMIFWGKIAIFHKKYPKYFRASLRSAQFEILDPPL